MYVCMYEHIHILTFHLYKYFILISKDLQSNSPHHKTQASKQIPALTFHKDIKLEVQHVFTTLKDTTERFLLEYTTTLSVKSQAVQL